MTEPQRSTARNIDPEHYERILTDYLNTGGADG